MAQLFKRNGKYVTLEVAQKMQKEELEARYPDKVVKKEGVEGFKEIIKEEELVEDLTKVDKTELEYEALEDCTDEELKEMAKSRGIKGFGNMKRETLLNKLK